MWLFTKYGFYSVACGKTEDGAVDASVVVVRARSKKHLENLKARIPGLGGYEILDDAGTDYEHRIIVRPEDWHAALAELGGDIDYHNFKDRAAVETGDEAYASSLMEVWAAMASYLGSPVWRSMGLRRRRGK